MGRYLANQAIVLSVTVTDPVTGNPIDPSAVTLTVYRGDGVTVAAGPFTTPTHSGTGAYQQQVTGLGSGLNYQGVWRTTGTADGEFVELFDVVAPTSSTVTLATFPQLMDGPLADLVEGYDTVTAQLALMVEATRACETAANRRLVPFAGLVETHRATGIDPDEYPAGSAYPLTLETMGRAALGTVLGVGDQLVRHVWLGEYAARWPDLWTYTAVTVTVTDTAGAVQQLSAALTPSLAPAPDSGHLQLPVGTWAPVGSWITVRYSGGYTVTIPDDLVRAGKYMAASIAADDLDPLNGRAQALRGKAEHLLQPYHRS